MQRTCSVSWAFWGTGLLLPPHGLMMDRHFERDLLIIHQP